VTDQDWQDFPPHVLREYALLADGERGALCGPRGDLAWLCAPGWDDPAVLSTLVGGGGTYSVSPVGTAVWGGYYEPGTLIWRNHWITTDTVVECREALAFPGDPHRVVLLRCVAAGVMVQVVPALHAPSQTRVEQVVTVALLCILFDGGMHIGWSRFRAAAGPILVVGVLGTFLTVAAAAVLIHAAFGLGWYVSLLVVATAVATTDPAVVFSVLGQREVEGRSGTILEGESGANDPVGIALMASLLSAGGLNGHALVNVGGQFLLQMGIGAAVGVAGGRVLVWFIRRVPLPSEGLYPLRTLASALVLYGAASLAHGSGFLAVFVAGIVLGDGRAPFKREIERFHGTLASLVAFVVLGLTVNVSVLLRPDVWLPGLVLGVALAVLIRPVALGVCLLRARLSAAERVFVLVAGLKGAVPILLGGSLLTLNLVEAPRLYGIVVVVVVFSVLVQGSLVSTLARASKLPMRTVEPQPWALGVRLREEPHGAHRFTIAAGSPAEGRTIAELADLPGDVWVSLILRDQHLLPVTGDTQLHAEDDILVLADGDRRADLAATFETPHSQPKAAP
jgi:potassium/hydrogen antiporter